MAMTAGERDRGGWATLAVLITLLIAAPLAIMAFEREPGEDSVEAGFLRDMIVHHTQAVEMAMIIRDRTDDEQLRFLATDMLLSQQHQVGMMSGWLQLWDISPNLDGPHMAWMGHESDGLMPGLATTSQLEALRTVPVDEAEALFLELMIAHHGSAVDMAEAYLARGEQEEIVAFARNVIAVQDLEIGVLESMLAQLEPADTNDVVPGATPAGTPDHDGH